MKYAQTTEDLQNKILLPVIALKIELLEIFKWNFAESFILLFSRLSFKMVTFGWNFSEIWWFFEKKKGFKKGVPPNYPENRKRELLLKQVIQVLFGNKHFGGLSSEADNLLYNLPISIFTYNCWHTGWPIRTKSDQRLIGPEIS